LNKRPSVLLASGAASGTIAAVRNFGANGIDVGVVSSGPLSGAAWSRWTSSHYSAPLETSGRPFIDCLLEIGRDNPGQILLPTSDETAWLYGAYADVLTQHFRVYQPSLATIHTILDKKLFEAAVVKAGIVVLPSWHPRTIQEVEALMPDLPYPILIKPRTQVHRLWTDKGTVVYSASELASQYEQFTTRERTRVGDANPLLADVHKPILQQFVPVGDEGVLSVTGFIDKSGTLFVTRHSTKILQRSIPVGVGVCFETPRQARGLSDAVRRLCLGLGHFGIFEVEFVYFNGSWAAIDFNPRLFHQLSMDIRRGMPLPLLAYLDAAGEVATLQATIAKAQNPDENQNVTFCDSFLLSSLLLRRRLTGQMSGKDIAYWHSWKKRNAAHMAEAAIDSTDPIPGYIHALSEVQLALKSLTVVP
jgi:D-aspartate ligase